ncbi:MAG: hypothetical protein ACJ8D0_13415 [Xanthobacteraceae bacterium]
MVVAAAAAPVAEEWAAEPRPAMVPEQAAALLAVAQAAVPQVAVPEAGAAVAGAVAVGPTVRPAIRLQMIESPPHRRALSYQRLHHHDFTGVASLHLQPS